MQYRRHSKYIFMCYMIIQWFKYKVCFAHLQFLLSTINPKNQKLILPYQFMFAWYNLFTHTYVQFIPKNMHPVFALLCFLVVIHWLIFPYPSGLLHWHCGNLTIAPMPAKQPWWIWINTSCEFIMNDCITTTKQSTTKQCAYYLGYTVFTHNVCVTKSAIMSHPVNPSTTVKNVG